MGNLKDFKYNIGDKIDNLLIINRKRKLNNRGVSQKYYNYICQKCTYSGNHTECELNEGKRCPVCAGKKVLVGYNDLWTTNPEVAKLLRNPDDGHKYSRGSHKKVDFICPKCNKINNKTIRDVVRYNLSCQYCSDSISIPEKFMMNILNQMNVEYVYQLTRKTFDWIENFRYDFYLVKENTIIEVQGRQHLCDIGDKKFGSFNKQVETDNKKMELAIKNGITTYIQMDFSNSSYEYLYNSVMNSAFHILFDIRKVDFKKCYKNALKSFVIIVCDLWNKGLSIGEIMIETNLSNYTVRYYLEQGKELELCNYNSFESNSRASKLRYKNGTEFLIEAQKNNRKKIYCITTNEYFLSRKDALEKYPNANHISSCCTNKRKTSGKDKNGNRLKWRYWNEQEIREYETIGELPERSK